MKKVRYILFVFMMMMLFPFGVMADENKVYWDDLIGGNEKINESETVYHSLKNYLINNSSYNLDDVVKIVFNDVSSTGNTISLDGIDISRNEDNTVVAILEDNVTNDILYIQYSGKLVFNSDSSYLFKGFSKTTRIDGLEYVDTSEVTDMSYMFSGLTKLVYITLSKFNTSKVVNMAGMFADTESLERIDLDSFDTSNVTNMSYMFKNSDFGIGNQLYLSSFDTSKVTDMSYMFYNSGELSYIYVSDLWDVSNVTNSYCMFKSNYLLNGHNGTEANIYYCQGKEYAKIDYPDSPGYLSVHLWLRSDEYEVREDYVYTGSEKFDISKMKVNRGELKEENNRLNVYYDGKLLESNYIITVSSDEYNLADGVVDIGPKTMDISKINVINGRLEYENDKIYIYHVNGGYIDQMKVFGVSSSEYDLSKDYIYIGTKSFDTGKINVSNGGWTFTNSEYKLYCNSILVKTYKVIYISSETYKIDSDKKYIYVGNKDIDVSDFTVKHGTAKIENNKLNIYYGDILLDSYELVRISSEMYDLTKDYIYVGINKLDISKIDITNGNLKEENNKLNIYHSNELLGSYNIISVSSDKYEFTDEYVYIGDDELDLSKINVTNGILENLSEYDISIKTMDNQEYLQSFRIYTGIKKIRLFPYYAEGYEPSLRLDYDTGFQIDYAIEPWDAMGDKTLTWVSSDESVVKVDQNGNVTPVGVGIATITVTTANGKSDSVKITVYGGEIKFENPGDVYYIYNGKEHRLNLNILTPNATVLYSLDGINYNLTESPGIKDPGQLVVYYKIKSDYYNDYNGAVVISVSGIGGFDDELRIKNKYLIVNNSDFSLFRLIHGINLMVYSHFYEYRYIDLDGKVCYNGSIIDFDYTSSVPIQTGYKLDLYIGNVVEPPLYSYEIVLRGDLSGDGDVDSLDLATMLNHISGKKELMGAHLEAAYLNEDEDIDSLDLAYLMNHIAGKEGY